MFAAAQLGNASPWLLDLGRWIGRFCWIFFCLFWVISWLSKDRPVKRSQSTLSRALQIPFYLLGVVLIFLSKLVPLPALDARLLPRSDILTVTATLLTVAGVAFAIRARALLGSNWSARATVKEGHELILSGPYRLVRHPIYTGLLVAFLGTALLRCSPRSLLGVAVFLGVFVWKIRIEERFLTAEFGESYLDYKRRVKALIPFVV